MGSLSRQGEIDVRVKLNLIQKAVKAECSDEKEKFTSWKAVKAESSDEKEKFTRRIFLTLSLGYFSNSERPSLQGRVFR